MSTLSFDGDVIVVTGAGGGMGRCHALELARRGARIVVNDLGGHPFGGGSDASLAQAVVDEIRAAGGHAVANTASVATPDGAASLTEQAMDEWGRLDAVVANAAILRDKPFEEMTLQDFDDVIDVNLRGVMRVVHPAFKAMKAGGGGRIVTVTSSSGMLGAHHQANYAAAKSGIVGLTRTVALEGMAHGIKANVLAPGALGTRMHLAMMEAATYHADADADLVRNEQAAALMKPERVSPMVTVLTHRTCPVTGQILCSWGGWYGRFGITLNDGWAERVGIATAEDLVAHWGEVTGDESAHDAGLDAFAHGTRSAQEGARTQAAGT
ncbi:MAG TPA: SDR family NAD(P)-dependent oxidoreductase [Acidimicrobiales bacterium]|nr:SDR family NAD(P)-dependent oxidoreductase [Acidimicrobiales bacterium]